MARAMTRIIVEKEIVNRIYIIYSRVIHEVEFYSRLM